MADFIDIGCRTRGHAVHVAASEVLTRITMTRWQKCCDTIPWTPREMGPDTGVLVVFDLCAQVNA